MDKLMNVSHKVLWAAVGILGLLVVILSIALFAGHSGPAPAVKGGFVAGSNTNGQLTIVTPSPNASIGDPLSVTGMASGVWAKAPFSVSIFSGDSLLGSVPALLRGLGVSSTDNVEFTADLPYVPVHGGEGKIVFSITTAVTSTAEASSFSMPIHFQ